MGYTVVERFCDITDNGYEYRAGDIFPRNGLYPSESRIKVLSTSTNALHRPLIVEDTFSLPEKAPKEPQAGETTGERPKGKGRARKG